MKKSGSLSRNLLLIGMGLLLPFLAFTVLNGILSPWPLYERNKGLLCLLLVLVAGILFLLLNRPSRSERVLRALPGIEAVAVIVFFIVQVLCALWLRHTPNTDAEQVMTAAINQARTGAFETSQRSYRYFSWYPFNLPTVYLYAFLFQVTGVFGIADSYMTVAVFDAFLFTAGLLAGAAAAERLGGKGARLRFLILCLLCFPFYYCTAELYTDVLALPFSPMILLMYLKAREDSDRRWLYVLLFSLLTLAGSLLRVTCLIPAIACLISALFEKRFRLFLSSLLLTAVFLATGNAAMEAVHASHLGQEQLRVKRLSVWHYLAMGLPAHEDEGYGQYGDGGWLILSDSFEDPDARDAVLREKIKDKVYYLRYPNRLLNMVSRKNLSTFGNGTFNLNHLIEADEHEPDNPLKSIIYSDGPGYPLYYHLCTAIFYAQMLLGGASLVMQMRRRETGAAPVYLALVGAFIYLTLWETNARYFFAFEFLLLLASALCPVVPGHASGQLPPTGKD